MVIHDHYRGSVLRFGVLWLKITGIERSAVPECDGGEGENLWGKTFV